MQAAHEVAAVIRIPLRNRKGEAVGYAVVDAEDARLAETCWHMDRDGYAAGVTDGRRHHMARDVLGLAITDRREADHINRDRLDNRRSNLRAVTHAQNHQNRGANREGSSRHRGVHWHKATGKWKAEAKLNGERHYLGVFVNEADAAAAARSWRLEHMPFSNEAVAA